MDKKAQIEFPVVVFLLFNSTRPYPRVWDTSIGNNSGTFYTFLLHKLFCIYRPHSSHNLDHLFLPTTSCCNNFWNPKLQMKCNVLNWTTCPELGSNPWLWRSWSNRSIFEWKLIWWQRSKSCGISRFPTGLVVPGIPNRAFFNSFSPCDDGYRKGTPGLGTKLWWEDIPVTHC